MRGKAMNVTESVIWQQDHPRLCGEKRVRRGKWQNAYRITPAYAGKRDQTAVIFLC